MPPQSTADVAVIGLGGIGSATVLELARRKIQVIGVEAGDVAHHHGSSHGETRLFRALHASEHRRRLATEALAGWERLHAEAERPLLRTGEQLLIMTADAQRTLMSAIDLEQPDGEQSDGEQSVARVLSGAELAALGFVVPKGAVAVVDPQGAVLAVERCIIAQCAAAQRLGARLHFRTAATSLVSDQGYSTIRTRRGSIRARRVVVACGAWSARFFPAAQLTVHRVPQVWFATSSTKQPTPFVCDLPSGEHYGAGWKSGTFKVGGGRAGILDDPNRRGDDVPTPFVASIAEFVRAHVPALHPVPLRAQWCMTTASPDEEFIIDETEDGTVVAAGFSGRGYKYAPAVARLIADLACGHRTGDHTPYRYSRFGAGLMPTSLPLSVHTASKRAPTGVPARQGEAR